MQSSLFISTFITIFLAEIGDKTQLIALSSSAKTQATGVVLAAVIAGLSFSAGLSVLAGRLLQNWINLLLLQRLSGLVLIILGILTLWNSRGSGV